MSRKSYFIVNNGCKCGVLGIFRANSDKKLKITNCKVRKKQYLC